AGSLNSLHGTGTHSGPCDPGAHDTPGAGKCSECFLGMKTNPFKRTYELTSSIVPRGTSFRRWAELDFLLLRLIRHGSQAAATSLVHRNSVPSTHTRCMTTAKRRASATIAFFIPRCLATFIAQALSQDHFVERTSMLWAAS